MMPMISASAARSTSETKSLRPLEVTVRDSRRFRLRTMTSPARRAAITAILRRACTGKSYLIDSQSVGERASPSLLILGTGHQVLAELELQRRVADVITVDQHTVVGVRLDSVGHVGAHVQRGIMGT